MLRHVITPPARLPLHYTSRRPSSLPLLRSHRCGVLPHDHIAAAASLIVVIAPRASLIGVHHMRPITGAAQLLTGDRAAARSLSASFSTMTAQPDPAVQCSAYQVLLKVNAVSVCFKCFRFRGMLQVF
jgi:hypothetical protein